MALNALNHAIMLRQMTSSMSGKGNCYDNAVVETVFKTIKHELVWKTPWQTRQQAQIAIGKYINQFYNPERRHSAQNIIKWGINHPSISKSIQNKNQKASLLF